MPIYMLL